MVKAIHKTNPNKKIMAERYRYIKIGGRYFCLQQNLAVLAWFSYFRNKALQLHSLDLGKRKAMRCLIKVVQYRLRVKQHAFPVLELPVSGTFCLAVHRGHKVFDFQRKTAIKVIAPEAEEAAVVSEIEGARQAGLLDFVPTIWRWNVKQRWYEEDFIIGERGYTIPQSTGSNLLQIYYRHIAPLIEAIILLKPPVTKKVGRHLDEIIEALDNERMSSSELDCEKIKSVRCFVEAVVRRLRLYDTCPVDLIFSHGDFSFVNILSSNQGMVVIDWESAAHRNILNDFYNWFFTELYYRRVKTDLVAEINEALISLQSSLTSKGIGIVGDLQSKTEFYRWLYYIERIQMLLEREPSEKLLNVMMRSIEVFNHYEEIVGNQRFSDTEF